MRFNLIFLHLMLYLCCSPALPVRSEPFKVLQPAPGYPKEVREIRYTSSADQSEQPGLYYSSQSDQPKPLLVGLHTWSGDYLQKDGKDYAQWCIERDWVFVHPNFRGPNKTPEALGSDLAVQDVLSLVDQVQEHDRIDARRIYLVGVSGGGHMALLLAGRAPERWAGVSAWCGISNVTAWHKHCRHKQKKYARMMEAACGGPPGLYEKVDAEYTKRSPLTWLQQAKGIPLDIQAGLWDGHKGSVPIAQSMWAFNYTAEPKDRFSRSKIQKLTRSPDWLKPAPGLHDPAYGKKEVLLRRVSGNTRLTLFKGGHEMIHEAALSWLSKQIKPVKTSPE